MLDKLNYKIFSECLNSSFHIFHLGQALFTAELVTVADKSTSPRMEQFSLVFRGPMTPVLAQGIRNMEHATLGKLQLFLVPIGPDGSGMCYEAVFNRFRKAEP
jgi:hypothetical protein